MRDRFRGLRLLFARKRKTEGVVRLEYQSVKLNLRKEVKYLDVILDDKLMWKSHVRAQVKKGLKALWSCNAYIGRTWGLSPKMALLLYKRMIIPKITYVTVAWWDGMDSALARSELERLQRAACMYYDQRGCENNSNKSVGDVLESANQGRMVNTGSSSKNLRRRRCFMPLFGIFERNLCKKKFQIFFIFYLKKIFL